MAAPPEHLRYLHQFGYTPPDPGAFDAEETALLTRYGYWLGALCNGVIAPITPEQQRFLLVARGEATPTTALERIWVKVQQQQEAGSLLGAPTRTDPAKQRVADHDAFESLIAELVEARKFVETVSKQRDAERDAVLAPVRDQLDVVEARYAAQLESANRVIAELENAVKEGVLRLGRSVQVGDVRAIYARGRTTWDSQGLTEYAAHHPEVEQYRKVGKPTAYLRYPSAGGE